MTTLTVTAEPKNWQNAIKVAVQEVCSAICFITAATFGFFFLDSLFVILLLAIVLFLIMMFVFVGAIIK